MEKQTGERIIEEIRRSAEITQWVVCSCSCLMIATGLALYGIYVAGIVSFVLGGAGGVFWLIGMYCKKQMSKLKEVAKQDDISRKAKFRTGRLKMKSKEERLWDEREKKLKEINDEK